MATPKSFSLSRRFTLSLALAASTMLMTAGSAGAEVQGRCIQDDRIAAGLAPFSGNFCTANDLTFVLIGLGIQEDGCLNSADGANILNLRAIIENTGAATRYDAGLWISIQGDQTRCKLTGQVCAVDADCPGGQNTCVSTARWGACAREFFREPAFQQGNITCTPATGGVDIACGGPPPATATSGPYINDDGDGCGDVRKFGTGGPPDCGRTVDLRIDPTNSTCNIPDGSQDQSVFDFEGTVTFPCVDGDGDGFMEIPTCTSWGQNTSDIQCPAKTCSTAGTQCVVDADCPVGQTCNAPTCNICAGNGAVCASNANCPAGQECVGTCDVTGSFCSDLVPCSGGQTCSARTCQGSGDPCTVNANCPTGQVCVASSDPICRTQLTVAGTSAKCACEDGLNSNVPVADLSLSCTCDAPTTVRPGFPVTCEVSYNNPQPPACVPDLSVAERFRCGANGYLRFDLDDGIAGAGSGTFSGICSGETGFCSGDTSVSCSRNSPDCDVAGGPCLVPTCSLDTDCPAGETCSVEPTSVFVSGTPSQLLWSPASGAGTEGIVGTGESGSLRFIYTVSSSASDGPITVTALSQWTNKTCSAGSTNAGVVCEQDSQCTGGTCDLDFSAAVTQPLSATCPINVDATYAAVSSFTAREDSGRVVVEWETASEVGTVGFHLLRQDEATGAWERVNDHLIAALQHVPGGRYRVVDETASPRQRLTYRLVEVDVRGSRRPHGPFRAEVEWDRAPLAKGALEEGVAAAARQPSERTLARLAASRKASMAPLAGKMKPSSDRAKIAVADSGLYFVAAAEIAAALGQPQARIQNEIRQGHLRLSLRDEEVSWEAAEDRSGIFFYGEAIDSLFTRDNVYRIESAKGRRMDVVEGDGPAPTVGPATFSDTVHHEEDLLGRPVVALDPLDDYWFWEGILSSHPVHHRKTFSLDLQGVAPTSPTAELAIGVYGFTNEGGGLSHRAEIHVNGMAVGEIAWEGNGSRTKALPLAQDLLREGANTVEVVGLEGDFFVDSFDVRYSRLYRAVDGSLAVRGDGNPTVTVSSFADADISVYEISDPRRPTRIDATTVDVGPDGSHRVSFTPASPDALYLAVSGAAVGSAASVRGDVPSQLRARNNRAEYLVIAPAGLRQAAQALADQRQASGLASLVVDVEDAMDEFNYGIPDPEAIRDFLSYAYANWHLPPRYVVLAGKGSFDYRDLLGHGGNLVPPRMASTASGLVPADSLYGDVVGDDDVPEIAVGRLPVLSAGELLAYVDKISAYESAAGGDWARQVLMVADNPDRAGDFHTDSDRLAAALPDELGVERIYLSPPELSADEARQQTIAALRRGAVLFNFVGHGGLDRLTAEGLLRTIDIPELDNGERLPLVATLTCNIGLFAFPGFVSLGEELMLHDEGGASAVWGPTGLSLNYQAVDMGDHLFAALFASDERPIGEVLLETLESFAAGGGNREVLRVYGLLGDPSVKLKSAR